LALVRRGGALVGWASCVRVLSQLEDYSLLGWSRGFVGELIQHWVGTDIMPAIWGGQDSVNGWGVLIELACAFQGILFTNARRDIMYLQ
jgi:hypothetical protein